MPDTYRHFTIDRDGRGVVTVYLDVQGMPVNVLTDEVIAELDRIIGELESDTPRLVLFRSPKPSGFLAGADIRRIKKMDTPDEARTAVDAGWRLFERLAHLPCPTVAIIHGVCLGGGLEFALACRYRIARDDPSTRIGLPETQLGLLPGWGGTQRLPRLIGLRAALRMILEAGKLSAAEAAEVGLVDRAAAPEQFESMIERFITELLSEPDCPFPRPRAAKRRGLGKKLLDETWLGRMLLFRLTRRALARRGGHYPALAEALAAVEAGLRHPNGGRTIEREAFARVLFTNTARHLLELYFQRERAGKAATWVRVEAGESRPIRRVAILGAGAMGAGIAQLAAINGYQVVLKELNVDLAEAGMTRVRSLMDDAVRKGVIARADADLRMRAVTATSEWAPLEDADLAIEAVIERASVKREVFAELGRRLPGTAILATNTSSLTVSSVAEPAPQQARVAGLHFFNPVHRMQLVEVVRGHDTDSRTIATLVEFVRRLGKAPVVVADGPGFLVNRILFPYLDEAVRMLDEGYSIKAIDESAVRFGMPMGPLELLDQVGLDVAADVAASLAVSRGDQGPTPERLAGMVARGWLGRKSDRGFYAYHHGRRGRPAHRVDAAHEHHSLGNKADPPSPTGLTGIQRRLIYPMINEAAHCLETGVADAPWVIDLAMVLGTGFAPFRGGPLAAADTWGIDQVVRDLENLSRGAGPRFEPFPLLREMNSEGRRFYPPTQPIREPAAQAARI